MFLNKIIEVKGSSFSCLLFLFLFGSFFCYAQKEQFVGLHLGSAKYIDERAIGSSIGAFYEVKNSTYWSFGFDIQHSFVDALPKGLNIGSHTPLQYLEEVNGYFIGSPVASSDKTFFSNYDIHFTCYANFMIPIKKFELIPAIGVGYGHISTVNFSLTRLIYNAANNLITEVKDYSVAHWQKGTLNISPRIRLLYNLSKNTGIFVASTIIINAAYQSDENFDLGYTGTWSHNIGLRIKI